MRSKAKIVFWGIGIVSMFILFRNAAGAMPAQTTANTIYLPLVLNNHIVRQIAFIGERTMESQNIFVVNDDGTGFENLSNNPLPMGDDTHFSWSADGEKIVFRSNRDDNAEIYLTNADGTNPTNLTNHPGYDSSPAMSPDGNRIAFSSDRDGSFQVYAMNIDGRNVVQLTDSFDVAGIGPSWAPDMSKIGLMVGDYQGNRGIWMMDPDGSNLENLTIGEYSDELVWSPDGADILFRSERDLFLLNIATRNIVKLTNTDDVRLGIWSPDGLQIAYTQNGDPKIYIIERDGSASTELTCDYGDPDTYNPGSLSWSPDGTHLAFTPGSGDGGTEGVYAIAVDGRQCTRLVQIQAYDPQWRPAQ